MASELGCQENACAAKQMRLLANPEPCIFVQGFAEENENMWHKTGTVCSGSVPKNAV
jgi:hypothetical protein